jgi:biotin carboxylase
MNELSPIRHNRVMLLISPATYRSGAFARAAEKLGLETIIIIDLPGELSERSRYEFAVDFGRIEESADHLVNIARRIPVDAVLSLDDAATELAAVVGDRLGLPSNSPESATAARDKFVMRNMLRDGGAPVPHFELVSATSDPAEIATRIEFPCVVKPIRLSGSRGVIRANDPEEFISAFNRVVRMLVTDGYDPATTNLLVEEYIPGFEVALEGLLTDGSLQVLTLFDKPDPLEGPFFEETIYLTPSRLPKETQQAIYDATAASARALGLKHGPVHAELRVNDKGAWMVELAGRSIGGLCSTILEFGAGAALEEIILQHAVGNEIQTMELKDAAAGVMMIPIPKGGMLRGCSGIEDALQVEGIEGIEITAPLNYPVVPLPEGSSYLGFIFAKGETPEDVDSALREAHARITFRIDPIIPVMVQQ